MCQSTSLTSVRKRMPRMRKSYLGSAASTDKKEAMQTV